MEDDQPSVTLKVGELTSRDEFGRGIIRVDTKTMSTLSIKEGDVVELTAKRRTGALAVRAYPADVGLSVIRMDGITRRNAGVGVGETIKITKARVQDAKRVLLAPIQKGVILQINPEILKKNLYMRPVTKGDVITPFPVVRQRRGGSFEDLFGSNLFDDLFGFTSIPGEARLIAAVTSPDGVVRVTEATQVELSPEPIEMEDRTIPTLTYEDIGGLGSAIQKIREMVELPLRHPELFTRLGIDPPKGVLLYGPPGTGKTLLAKAVANESGAHFVSISGPEIMSKWYGQSEQNLRKIFKDAEKNAPAIIFIDEIDSIAPKREEVTGEVERRVVSQLLTLMDGLKSRGKVIVIAATNRENALDQALRRGGRFDREVEIGVPDQAGRKEILQIHTRNMPLDHWDGDIAAKVLVDRVVRFKEISAKQIEEKKRNIEKVLEQKQHDENALRSAIAELRELERESKQSPSSLAQRIVARIANKKSEIEEIRLKIDGIKDQIEQLTKKIQKIEEDVVRVAAIRETAIKSKDIIDSIGNQINEIVQSQQTRSFDDIRNIFSERILEEKVLKLKEIEETLLETGVISIEYLNEVIAESIKKMREDISKSTYGFVGADLEALCKEAAMSALRRVLPDISWKKTPELPPEIYEKLKVKNLDFKNAQKMVGPSAMREVLIERPNVRWDSVGGLEEVKQQLQEAVQWPLSHPDAFRRMGIRPPKGILMYGPPGTGKTMLAKAVATESDANFISIRGPEVLSKWVGESEKHIREIFRRAKQVAPAIVFFDEIDSVASRRGGSDSGSKVNENVVSTILTEMSGLEDLHDVVVIAATNRPDIIDSALLRPGRFDRQILVPAPDERARLEIFRIHTESMPITLAKDEQQELQDDLAGMELRDQEKKVPGKKARKPAPDQDLFLTWLAKRTEGFSGADIEAVCKEAGILALREDIAAKSLSKKHFDESLKQARPSITQEMQGFYRKVAETIRSPMKEKPREMSYVG